MTGRSDAIAGLALGTGHKPRRTTEPAVSWAARIWRRVRRDPKAARR